MNVRNKKMVVVASENQPNGQKFKMLYLGRRKSYFNTFFCYHHNFSMSITYVRISKIHD